MRIEATTKPNGSGRFWLETGHFEIDDFGDKIWKYDGDRYPQNDSRLKVQRKYDGRGASQRIYWLIDVPDDYPLTIADTDGDVYYEPPKAEEAATKDIVVYDIEIEKAILMPEEEPIEGIEYCDGWGDKENMGISVIGAYSYQQDRYRIFTRAEFPEFQEMVNDALLVGFNSESFDDLVCAENGLNPITHYDILREVYKAKGLDPYPEEYGDEYAGHGLNAISKANGIGEKSGHGAHAPVDWQQGKVGKVIDYCLQDVQLTKKLLDLILDQGKLTDPITGETLKMREVR